jgi:hypothetical protein
MPHQSIFQAEAMPLLNYITQGVKLIDLEGDGRLVELAWAEQDEGKCGADDEPEVEQ